MLDGYLRRITDFSHGNRDETDMIMAKSGDKSSRADRMRTELSLGQPFVTTNRETRTGAPAAVSR
jgi:hypothetical protein